MTRAGSCSKFKDHDFEKENEHQKEVDDSNIPTEKCLND